MKPQLQAEYAHLANLLDAIQFLDASVSRLTWPLTAEYLYTHKKDIATFESIAAINERFAKLQDTVGTAMRHAYLLAGESGDTFLKILAFYEKIGVLESVASWQLCRTTRNLAAHEYDTDYADIAEHFNTLHTLIPILYGNADRFLKYCHESLNAEPGQSDFTQDFAAVILKQGSCHS